MSDRFTYSREEVEKLLEAKWSAGIVHNELTVDPDMPKAKANPAHQGNTLVYMIDIDRAWHRAQLTTRERSSLYHKYAYGRYQAEIASRLEVDQSQVSRALATGLDAVHRAINGQ